MKANKKRRLPREEEEELSQVENHSSALSDIMTKAYETKSYSVMMSIEDGERKLFHDKAVELQKVIQKLHNAIDVAREFSTIQCTQGDELQLVNNVLDHSHRTSYTTGAPPGYVPGKSALYLVKPPAPQTAQFQNSILHTAFIQHEKAMYTEQHAEIKNKVEERQPAAGAGGVSQQQQNPVEKLLQQLPPMPKEWKPGDPIPGLVQEEKKPDKATKKPAGFAFSLNPDMDVEFDVAESSDEDSSSDDDY